MSIFPKTRKRYELTLVEKIKYVTCLSFVWLVSRIPLRGLYVLCSPLYIILYKVVGYRKSIVRKNLVDSFPDKSHEEILSIEKKFYHWMCDEIMETIKLMSFSEEEIKRRVTFHGIENILSLLGKGKNVALYLGHYGNWEWMTSVGLYLPKDACQCQVYHELKSHYFDSLMLKIREGLGTENVNMPNILRRVVKCRKEGKLMVCGFISDQVPLYSNTHYCTNFLNHKNTLVITGTERLAKQCNFGCLYLDIKRTGRGYYDVDIIPLSENSNEIPDWEITERYYRLLEKTIMREPSIWLWSHNRWKRDLNGLAEWCKWNRIDPEEKIEEVLRNK